MFLLALFGLWHRILKYTTLEAVASAVADNVMITCIAGYDYGQVLGLSILFYEAQRSGALPATNRVAWRGDSAVGDVSPAGTDVSGGWYDAGGKSSSDLLYKAKLTSGSAGYNE